MYASCSNHESDSRQFALIRGLVDAGSPAAHEDFLAAWPRERVFSPRERCFSVGMNFFPFRANFRFAGYQRMIQSCGHA